MLADLTISSNVDSDYIYFRWFGNQYTQSVKPCVKDCFNEHFMKTSAPFCTTPAANKKINDVTKASDE